jgi:hypothetical protein
MSVRFEKEQVRVTDNVRGGRNEDTAHKIGEALTGGKSQTGYLAVRLSHSTLRCPHPRKHIHILHLHHLHTATSESSTH